MLIKHCQRFYDSYSFWSVTINIMDTLTFIAAVLLTISLFAFYVFLPKVIWEECVATPHSREYSQPLHVLLAAQLQTSPITLPRVHNICTTVPHSSYTLCPGLHLAYIVLSGWIWMLFGVVSGVGRMMSILDVVPRTQKGRVGFGGSFPLI